LVLGAEPVVHGVHVSEDQQYIGADFATQDRRHAVLVGHRVDPLEAQDRVVVDGRPAAPACDDDVPGGDQVVDHVPLHHGDRLRARREPPPAARLLLPDRNGACQEPRHSSRVE